MGVAEDYIPDDRAGAGSAPPPNPYLEDILRMIRGLSDYVSGHDLDRIRADIEMRIREHPGASLAIGFGVGLLLGKLIKR